MDINNVGDKLRHHRKKKDVTLTYLSDKTGLSIGYLSNLENNLSSPRLDDLHKICSVLDISLVELLSQQIFDENVHIIKKYNRQTIFHNNREIKYESVKFGRGFLEGLFIELAPNCNFAETWFHNYDEIGLVTEGQLILTINSKNYTLNEGDSIYIKAGTEHTLSNESNKSCKSYWVSKPVETK